MSPGDLPISLTNILKQSSELEHFEFVFSGSEARVKERAALGAGANDLPQMFPQGEDPLSLNLPFP